MCRLLGYLGERSALEPFLYLADNALIRQTWRPRMMNYSNMLNLAGFGMTVWNKASYLPEIPYIYKSAELPFFDKNLKSLSLKLRADCFVAHIRGVVMDPREVTGVHNVHPFLFDGHYIVLAHNGTLEGLRQIKHELTGMIRSDIAAQIIGTTDSEIIYALLLSQFACVEDENDIDKVAEALQVTLAILRKLRKKHQININSPLNLYISNGEFLVGTRFAFDYGMFVDDGNLAHMAYHSMWYTFGKEYVPDEAGKYEMSAGPHKSLLLASEPLTGDITSWLEVPEYSLIKVWRDSESKDVKFFTQDIDI